MARNISRDEREAQRRRQQLLEAGLSLFAAKGIEAVSLQEVASAADVGTATLYNYYQNKVNLLIAISAKLWEGIWKDVQEKIGWDALMQKNAYQLIELYADLILQLYCERPEVLCFSGNYKTYIHRESISNEQLREHLDVLAPLGVLFHTKYEEAKVNGCIRTDVPEKEMFTTVTLTMLGMAERYAQGIVWADDRTETHIDHSEELVNLKEMILLWVKVKKT